MTPVGGQKLEAVLPLVKLLGIGLGFSLYHFQNMIVGAARGRCTIVSHG